MIDQLNQTFGIEGQVTFQTGKGHLPKAIITNAFATAEVYLYGAHVTKFQPTGADPVIWMSPITPYEKGVAIRGGIPIAWPWFGPHPTDPEKPQHGFARVLPWAVQATAALPNGQTQLRLRLTDDEMTHRLWPHAFILELTVTVGPQMTISLTVSNPSQTAFETTAALHTYFNIGNIAQIAIEGLDGKAYLDKVMGYQHEYQDGSINIVEEIDRIYLDTVNDCLIHDFILQRQIRVAKAGSQTTVVWNPWATKAQALNDFPDDGYQTMVCVETTNAADDFIQVGSGGTHTLTQIISIDSPNPEK